MYITIKTLLEKGLNKSQISQAVKHDWKTVNKVIKNIQAGKEAPQRKPHSRYLESYKEEIIQWLEEGLSKLRIYEKLQEQGIQAGYSTVTEYCGLIHKQQNIFIRIHTKPAEEAQVDFGYFGRTCDDKSRKRKTWVFHMQLSYSRKSYYEKVYDQRVETFIQCHIHAFEYFGGIPEKVRIDNLKAAILQANFYEPVYQRQYKSFAEHYGFQSIPCRIYRPNDKGKVESGIKYVKNNFYAGRQFTNGPDLEKQLRFWQENTCNKRIHGTTRKIPDEVFSQEEKFLLNPLPLERFKMPNTGIRRVYHDCHIFVDYNYYSVPFDYVGKEVEIELDNSILKIYYAGHIIATHSCLPGKGEFSTVASHYPKYKVYTETEYQEKYQSKMLAIGPYAGQLFSLIIQQRPTDWSRSVQGILALTKKYPSAIVERSCKRAVAYGIYQYQTIKNICANGSYNLPVDFTVTQ